MGVRSRSDRRRAPERDLAFAVRIGLQDQRQVAAGVLGQIDDTRVKARGVLQDLGQQRGFFTPPLSDRYPERDRCVGAEHTHIRDEASSRGDRKVEFEAGGRARVDRAPAVTGLSRVVRHADRGVGRGHRPRRQCDG